MSWLIVPPCPRCGHPWRQHSHRHVGNGGIELGCSEQIDPDHFCACPAQPELPVVPDYETEDELVDDLLRRFSVRTGRVVWPTPVRQFGAGRGIEVVDRSPEAPPGEPSVVIVCLMCQLPRPPYPDRGDAVKTHLFHARECVMRWWMAGGPKDWPPGCLRCKYPEWAHPRFGCSGFAR